MLGIPWNSHTSPRTLCLIPFTIHYFLSFTFVSFLSFQTVVNFFHFFFSPFECLLFCSGMQIACRYSDKSSLFRQGVLFNIYWLGSFNSPCSFYVSFSCSASFLTSRRNAFYFNLDSALLVCCTCRWWENKHRKDLLWLAYQTDESCIIIKKDHLETGFLLLLRYPWNCSSLGRSL